MSMPETMDGVLGRTGKYSEDKKEAAKALIVKMAEICKGQQPDVVLLVLESALTETIHMISPLMGQLFEETMHSYKEKASMLIQLGEMLQHLDRADEPFKGI